MAPKNINDILNSMGAGGNTSALAPYSGAGKSNGLMNETIDERILRILGLQDVFDIDYDTYKSLLRERLAAARMSKSKIAPEEDELLRNEFKRVRGKEGRFKVKRKKITASGVGLGRSSSAIVKRTKISALSTALVTAPKVQKDDDKKSTSGILENLKSINSTLDKILKGVVAQGQSDKRRREKERGASERSRAQERESALEKPLQVAKSLVKKVIAPFQGILDKVFRFLGFTFLGWLIGKYDEIQKWFTANKEKVTIVSRFLKDWGPALLGAFVLFATPFGAFIRGTLKMLRFFIPQIIRLMAANPMLAGLTLATIGGIAKIKESERMKPLVKKDEAEIDKTLQSKEAPWYEKLGAGFAKQSLNAPGGPKNPTGLPMPGSMFKSGGLFSGFVNKNTGVSVKGFGQDTQAVPIEGGGTAVLKPGEVVMNTHAVNAIGADKLLGWNRQFGGPGANRPVNFTYKGGGILGLADGGMIGGGMLQFGRTFGGAPGTTQSTYVGGSLGGGAGQAQYGASGKLGYGGTYQQTAPEIAIDNALRALETGVANVQKPKERKGIFGNFNFDLLSFYRPSIPSPVKKTPEEKKEPGPDTMTTTEMVPTLMTSTPTEQEKAAYYRAVLETSKYGGGYYEKPGDAYSPEKVAEAMRLRDLDKRISDYRMKYEGPTMGMTERTRTTGGLGGFSKGGPFSPMTNINKRRAFNPMMGFNRSRRSGPFTTKTGIDIRPNSMGDSQLLPPVAVKPGEVGFIFSKNSVQRGAVSSAMNMMEQLDPNSAGKSTNLKRDIGPKVTFINLPDKVTNAQSKGGGITPGKPQLPEFDVIMDSQYRIKVASTLGIADLV